VSNARPDQPQPARPQTAQLNGERRRRNTARRARRGSALATAAMVLALPTLAFAQPAARDLGSRPIAWLVALTLLGLLPLAFMALTAFVKISTVLHIARSAIGVQGVPSSTVVLALAAALTLLAMAPVGERIGERISPVLAAPAATDTQLISDVVEAVKEPLRDFLSNNASDDQRRRFFELAQKNQPDTATDRDFVVVVPAFMVTELIEAFALGFAIFLPFLVLDLVIGNVLLALGMAMANPTQISLPFKLLLFVAADGWGLLAEALVTGYT